jgi:uncharacterized membrane-anchored protein YjiN (DUF445 family)
MRLASALQARHPAWGSWGYVAAFAEAAMVGAIADWFAVVALFRHPLGLPIPHTAIIPSNKDRIGAKLAGFICNNFLSTAQVLAKLRQFDAAGRIAGWLARPGSGQQARRMGVAATRYGLAAFDDERVRDFMGRAAAAGWPKIDLSRLTGQALDALTAGGRHQALLDDVLQQVASACSRARRCRRTSPRPSRARSRTLRYVGLDQVAAGWRRARSWRPWRAPSANWRPSRPPAAPALRHFHDFVVRRPEARPGVPARGEQIRAELLAHPALGDYLHGLWGELLGWLHDDLPPRLHHPPRMAAMAGALGTRLQRDEAIRRWINEQIEAAAPLAIERYREDIRRYIEERVDEWNAQEMTAELERNIGRDLQFIRINGTLVGGLVGLAIHTVTQLLRG